MPRGAHGDRDGLASQANFQGFFGDNWIGRGRVQFAILPTESVRLRDCRRLIHGVALAGWGSSNFSACSSWGSFPQAILQGNPNLNIGFLALIFHIGTVHTEDSTSWDTGFCAIG